MIPTEKILDEVRRVDEIVDGVPTSDEIREHADVSYWTIHDRFGGVGAVREAAGVGDGGKLCENHPDLADQEILDEVKRVANIVDRPPSVSDLDEHAEYEVGTMIYRFGGMGELRDEAGLSKKYNHHGDCENYKTTVVCEECGSEEQVWVSRAESYTYCSRDCMGSSHRQYTTDEIRSALVELAEQLGRAPSTREFDQQTEYMHGQFEMRSDLDSFSTELRKCGYEPKCAKDLSDEELLADLRRIKQNLGRSPRIHDLQKFGKLNTGKPYVSRWGSWADALKAAEIEPDNTQKVDISREKLIDEYQRVAEDLDKAPSYNEIDRNSDYSPATYERAFGSFLEAKAAAGYDPTPTDNQPRGEDHYAWKGGTKPRYGRNWRVQRQKAIERDGYTCQSCGMTSEEHKETIGKDLHVHHIDPWDEFDEDKERNKLNNLVTLCASCHKKWEVLPVRPEVVSS